MITERLHLFLKCQQLHSSRAGSTDSALRALAHGPPHLGAPHKKKKKGGRKNNIGPTKKEVDLVK